MKIRTWYQRLSDSFFSVLNWLWLKVKNGAQSLYYFFARGPKVLKAADNLKKKPDLPEEKVDFSFSEEGNQKFPTSSYAKMYDMSVQRKKQWLRNLIFLKKWSRPKQDEAETAQLLSQFSETEELKKLLESTDLSFSRNLLPIAAGDAYVNQEAFEEYLGHLAQHRHYHLFAHVLMSMLRKNSVSTVDLLKNLLFARDQLKEKLFFNEEYSLLYVRDKSSQWIASLMYRILPKRPLDLIRSDDNGPVEIESGKNILLCDDISYSGTQAVEMIEKMSGKEVKLTLLFGQMSLYALARINYAIKKAESNNANFKGNVVVGKLFHTLSAQLDFLPFRPTVKERHIFKQLLESDFSEQYRKEDFQRKPLLTTAWKKPDYVSSYYKFLGFQQEGPQLLAISSILLTQPPDKPITLFSRENPPAKMPTSKAFISGPIPPYRSKLYLY